MNVNNYFKRKCNKVCYYAKGELRLAITGALLLSTVRRYPTYASISDFYSHILSQSPLLVVDIGDSRFAPLFK